MSYPVQTGTRKANGMEFTCRTCGLDNPGELVILLHGFPEGAMMWDPMMKALASRGYRCFAPYQRGYSDGARPLDMEEYTYWKLESDVIALADTIDGSEKFHLVGHDWGAVVGWCTLTLHPERIASWSGLATPHPKSYAEAIYNDPVQKEKSQYIFDFMKPDYAEDLLAENDYAWLRGYWEGFRPELVEDYLRIFSQRDARTATVHYYRATMLVPKDEKNPPLPYGDITVPSLFIWGNGDVAVSNAGVDAQHPYMKGYYKYVQLDGADHWIVDMNYDVCEREILEIIEGHPIMSKSAMGV